MTNNDPEPQDITVTFGHEQIIIERRYETISILNDLMLGVEFLVGSVFFLYPNMQTAGVWVFIMGSAQLMIRPLIRLARHLHLRRIPHHPHDTWNF